MAGAGGAGGGRRRVFFLLLDPTIQQRARQYFPWCSGIKEKEKILKITKVDGMANLQKEGSFAGINLYPDVSMINL